MTSEPNRISGSIYLPLEDEESVELTLDGRNEVPRVIMMGWTNNIILKFPDLKEDLNVKTVNIKEKRVSWPKSLTPEMISYDTRKLRHYAERAQNENLKLTHPVNVMVLAKRSLHTTVKQGTLLIYGNLIIGDESGFCMVLVINNAVQTLYEQVNVGDRILIADGTFKLSRDSPFKTCFDEKNRLLLELKVSQYQCRRVFRLEGIEDCNKFPDFVTSGKQLRLPSKLPGLQDYLDPSINCNEFFDVIGVISYVGRLERKLAWKWEVRLENADTQFGEKKAVQTYHAFRWLELVDATSENPLPVLLYMNQSIWRSQPLLTPGCVVIITNVTNPKVKYGHEQLLSSVFTHIYINKGIGDYLERMCGTLSDPVKQLFGSGKMKEILERADVSWSVGGMYPQPFTSEYEYSCYFNDRPSNQNERIPRMEPPFVRRETQRIYFSGNIVKFRIFNGERTCQLWSKGFTTEMYDYKKICCIYPFVVNRNWYAFTQKLPKLDFNNFAIDKNGTRTCMNEFAKESYQQYCGPLLMPPSEDMCLKDLPLADGPPYYWVLIADTEKRHLYHTIWKPSRHLSLEQMTVKLETSKEKPVIGVIEMYCIDDKAIDVLKHEVILQDFTTMIVPKDPRFAQDVDDETKQIEDELRALHGPSPSPFKEKNLTDCSNLEMCVEVESNSDSDSVKESARQFEAELSN